MPTRQSNTDTILEAIGSLSKDVGRMQAESALQHKQNTEKFEGLERRLDYTNGNVKDLLLWQSNMRAVDDYKLAQENKGREAQASSNPKVDGLDYQKILMYALGLIGTALAIIGTTVGK